MKRIYLDYASLTPIDKRVMKEIKRYSRKEYANPSSWYKEGVMAQKAVDQARKTFAECIHAHSDEIVFTSGGTEANNIAIIGAIEGLHRKGVEYRDMHALRSPVEHSSVRECFSELERRGVSIEEINVDNRGVSALDDLKRKIKPNTVLISVMVVNNETGVIQPIKDLAKISRQARRDKSTGHVDLVGDDYPLLHADATQAGYLELNVDNLGVDLLTFDASKIYGPRGVGALFVRRNTVLSPIIFGGKQENKLRSGTENLPAIMGFAKAFTILSGEREREHVRLTELKQYLVDGLKQIRSDIKLNGDGAESSPHIANVSIPGIDNEFLVLRLDANGIACSTKSSCLRDDGESYVLKAMGADSKTSLRFSFGRATSRREIKKALAIITKFI